MGDECVNTTPVKRMLIIGAGSIGRRHATNLANLGLEVSVFDVDIPLLQKVCSENAWNAVTRLDDALDEMHFDAAVICTPNHLHIPYAQKAVDAGLHIFVEKPLSHSIAGVDRLIQSCNDQGSTGMVGFNLRFEPGLQYLKRCINPNEVAFAQVEFGSYLPGWRPGTDYTKGYSANKSMGGGIILDDIHEIDYACWLFGYPKSVIASAGTLSDLEIDVEDTAQMNFIYPKKLVAIHMDYLQRRYTRTCKICFRNGYSMEWVFGDHVTDFSPNGENIFSYKDRFAINDMYISEMKYFLDCILNGIKPESSLENAAKVLHIALEAKKVNDL